MRKKIVAGNWKMNTSREEALALASEVASMLGDHPGNGVQVIVAPPFIYLAAVVQLLKGSGIRVSAQNCAAYEPGAYTGEVAAGMLKSVGVEYVIIGHSERRTLFHETDPDVAAKVRLTTKHGMTPVLCVGETWAERESGNQESVVSRQLARGLFAVTEATPQGIVIAYEPVWAIGTGKTATPGQAQEMHAFIRKQLAGQYGMEAAESVSLLYGGSCNDKNARELFSMPDIDGGLIGGASLKSDTFVRIVRSF